MSLSSDKLLIAALEKLEKLQKQECFDPINPESKPTTAQKQVLDDFSHVKLQIIRAGNQSGKSQTCARLLTWAITETHPTWKRPDSWGNEPLLSVVAGRTGKQIEESLLPKIRSYLEPGSYKEVRIGNIIQRLELDNGNRIVFQSLENPTMARERLQSYVAHFVWVDELPPTVEVLNELLVRRQARNGFFLASFTPLVRNIKVQKFVDGLSESLGKTYRFNMLDNPLYSDSVRREEILSSLSHLPEHVRNSRLYGEWMSDDNAVYEFNTDTMVGMPENYSPLWRHVESVDPASSSALGYTLWAEDPSTGIWYCIKAEYVKGVFVPTEIINTVQKLSFGYNIIRRVSDTEPWFIHQAAQMGIKYTPVYEKANRKLSMIKNLQQALGTKLKISPHCESLIEELSGMRWSESKENKIVSSNDYHLHDTAAYFLDNLPKRESSLPLNVSWQAHLWKSHTDRKEAEEKQKIQIMKQAIARKGRTHVRRAR